MLHLNDHLYYKPCVFLWIANFRGLTAGFVSLPTLSSAFTVGHMYNQKYRGFHPRGYLSLLAITRHIFSFSFIQSCDPIGRCLTVLSPPNQTPKLVLIITMHSHPFNAMSSCICNAMCHCMLYHATCIMNVTWTMLKLYTSPWTMDNYINQHKISKRSHISCQYISTHISTSRSHHQSSNEILYPLGQIVT